MKIYWSDREGKFAPLGAKFHIYPFSKSTSFFLENCTIKRDLPPPQVPLKVLKKTYLPTQEVWEEKVEQALKLIDSQEIEKIVLARSCTFELASSPDPFAICSYLKQKAQGAFIFCVDFKDSAFLAASPERLFKRESNFILSEAMAGTRKRGKDFHEDQKLFQELFSSAKDLREIQPIQSFLRSRLTPFCKEPIEFSKIGIYPTSNVQHLYSNFKAPLLPNISDEAIIKAIHPTPALCGYPQQKALSFIEKIEPFDRMFYGGVVGWSDGKSSEWAVGIRSCFIKEKQVTLCTGTGIVKGSDPKKEWDELDNKMSLYESIFHY